MAAQNEAKQFEWLKKEEKIVIKYVFLFVKKWSNRRNQNLFSAQQKIIFDIKI